MKINIVMNPAFHQNSFKMHKKWINSLIKKKNKDRLFKGKNKNIIQMSYFIHFIFTIQNKIYIS